MKRSGHREKSPRRGLTVALVAVGLCGLLLWGVIHGILSLVGDGSNSRQTYSQADVVDYLSEQWPNYPLEDAKGTTVTVRGTALITYAQAEKYGAVSYDEAMLESYISTARAIATGLQSECGFADAQVILAQYSSDGQVIFTASSDGTVETCWD